MSTTEEKKVAGSAFWSEMFQAGLYKRSQGRIARQLTFAAIAVIVLFGGWRLAVVMSGWNWFRGMFVGSTALGSEFAAWIASIVVFIVPGLWFAYRIVNFSRFADFLISVEAEMNKVSWPSRSELVRAVIVVLVVVVVLAVVLVSFDVIWSVIFRVLNIRGGVIGGG